MFWIISQKKHYLFRNLCIGRHHCLKPFSLDFSFYFYTCESDLHVSLSFASVQTDTEQRQQSEETLQGSILVGVSVTIQSADYTTARRQVV